MNYKILDQDLKPREVIPKRNNEEEYHKRGYIPHTDAPNLIQSVTFRLADSIPKETLNKLHKALELLPSERATIEKRKKIEFYQDQGLGCCALGHPEVAQKMCDALLHFDNERYKLHAWTIMPNHVHVLFTQKYPLGKILHSWKSFTAKWVLARNKELGLKVPVNKGLWQEEYWDRYIRNEEHFYKAKEYIESNPVKAGLVSTAKDWRYGSVGYSERRDAS